MTLASRIAVMDRGVIQQVGTPTDIYEYPSSRFVAGFIGSINMFEATVTERSNDTMTVDLPALGGMADLPADGHSRPGDRITVAVRPEKITISRDRPKRGNAFAGQVKDLGYFGKDSLYRVIMPSGTLVSVNSVNARRVGEAERVAQWEDQVWLSFEPSSAIALSD